MKVHDDIQTLVTEVFKTNVQTTPDATHILQLIHHQFTHYAANFDLDDCDRILRIQSFEAIDTEAVIDLVSREGYWAQVLPDVADLKFED